MSATSPPPGRTASHGAPPASPHAPRTYLGWSLAMTLLCFLPLGLVALYHGYRAAQAIDRADHAQAERQSRRARRWLISTIVVGLILDLVLLGVLVLLGGFSS